MFSAGFGMLGVFGEFERAMIVARVKSGIACAKAERTAGKAPPDAQGRHRHTTGRPRIAEGTRQAIRNSLAVSVVMLKAAGVGSGTAQRIKRGMMTVA